MNRGTMLLLTTLSAVPLLLTEGCARRSASSEAPPPLAAPSAAAASAPEGDSNVRREIRALQARFQDAFRKKDMPGLLALLTPDFQQVTSDGSVENRRQIEENMRAQWPAIASYDDWTLTLKELDVRGNTATGIVRESVTVRFRHPEGTQKMVAISRNTWVKTSSGWKYQRMVTTEERAVPDDFSSVETIPAGQWARMSRAERAAARQKARRTAAGPRPSSDAQKTLTKAEARRTLESLYAGYRAAVRRRDVAAVMATTTDNYVTEYPTLIRTRSQVQQDLENDLKSLVGISAWTMAVQDVTVGNDTMTALLREKRTSSVRDRKGKTHTVATDSSMRDRWIRTREGWKNQRTQLEHGRTTIDGHLAGSF